MDPVNASRVGTYRRITVGGETYRPYLPVPLPPNPEIDLRTLQGPLERANQSVGRLDGISAILPNTALFLYMYVRKEALVSSQIEGTQSTLADLLIEDQEGNDFNEVSCYIDAMEHSLSHGFPLSLRLIREIHAKLLANGRGASKQPGEFRTSQNWLGGSRPGDALYVPPPPEDLAECLGALERFFHVESSLPRLVRAGLVHVQFETIHPFLDGNGRIGRLLITLLLCQEQALQHPILYLSLYLKQRRSEYYELLQRVRVEGVWEEWLAFFLEGVHQTAEQAVSSARRILALFEQDRTTILALGQGAASLLEVYTLFQRRPLLTVSQAQRYSSLSYPTVQKCITRLEAAGILHSQPGKQYGKLYRYATYLDILSEGTEPLPRSEYA
jgi:Fic family protein